jgi:hypothetical protein
VIVEGLGCARCIGCDKLVDVRNAVEMSGFVLQHPRNQSDALYRDGNPSASKPVTLAQSARLIGNFSPGHRKTTFLIGFRIRRSPRPL